MDDQTPPQPDKEKAAAGAPQPEGIKPIDPNAAAPASAQQLTKIEQEMSSFERSTLRWARTAVLCSVGTAFFVCAQWVEMCKGGADTHNLAIAAGTQATQMGNLANAAGVQAILTTNLAFIGAAQAGETKELATEAKVSADAAKSASETAKDALTVGEGAYITIGRKDGTIAELIPPKDPTQDANIVIYFQNSGHLPAKIAWGTDMGNDLNGITFIHPYPGRMKRTRDKRTGQITDVATTVAGESIFKSTLGTVSQKDMALAMQRHHMILGHFEYCDEFGTDIFTEFVVGATPNVSSDWIILGEFPHPLPPLPKATNTVEYLPPCETTHRENQPKKAN
jgi:hypothetical protein